MAIEVFNRHENKFLIDHHTFCRLQERLQEFMELDNHSLTHGFYRVSSIYYDTSDNHLIRTSLAKPTYKEKLRLRAYGVPRINSKVYIEIKKKMRGRVNKRRTPLRLHEAYDFIATRQKPALRGGMSLQVINEIEYFLRFHDVGPRLYLAYDRRAYIGLDNGRFRVTFDANIRTRRYDLRLETGDYGEPLLEPGRYVMEVKSSGNTPYRLAVLLSELRIFSMSFSKYGREYQKLLAKSSERRGTDGVCSIHC